MQINGFDEDFLAGIQRNLMLGSLQPASLERILPQLTRMDLPQGFVLANPEHPIQWIYFLDRGMCSMTNIDLLGTAVEVGVIGREGVVGVQALLGPAKTKNRMVMQGAGTGYRIRVEQLQRWTAQNGEFIAPLHRFLYVMLEQTTQLILCNRLHDLDARLARWLLMTSDFMETRSLQLTQEYLAEMLGVGRPAVTIAAGNLQRGGIITYSRGSIGLLNTEKLEKQACECYSTIRAAYRNNYPSLF